MFVFVFIGMRERDRALKGRNKEKSAFLLLRLVSERGSARRREAGREGGMCESNICLSVV